MPDKQTTDQSQIEDFDKLQIVTREAELEAEVRFKSKLMNI